MIELKPYNYENRLGRCTSRDEYGNADVKGVDMSFMLGLPYEEMAILAQALNRLADFEDAEIAEDKKLREKSNKKMNDDLISRQAAIEVLRNRWLKTRNYEGIGEDIAEECEIYLKTLPSAQPERKKGKWIPSVDRWGDIITTVDGYTCSECGSFNTDKDNYCPNCGADMRGEK